MLRRPGMWLRDRANLLLLAAPKKILTSPGKFWVVLPLGGWGAAAPAIVAALYPHSPTGMVGRGGPSAIAAAPYP